MVMIVGAAPGLIRFGLTMVIPALSVITMEIAGIMDGAVITTIGIVLITVIIQVLEMVLAMPAATGEVIGTITGTRAPS